MTFAETVRAARQGRKLSQPKLAAAAGLEESYISRLEAGRRRPGRDTVGKIADALGLDRVERHALYESAGFVSDDSLTMETVAVAAEEFRQSWNHLQKGLNLLGIQPITD